MFIVPYFMSIVAYLCRNGLIPKELHLEIALENINHEEGMYQCLIFIQV